MIEKYYIYADLTPHLPDSTDLGTDVENWSIIYCQDEITEAQKCARDSLLTVLSKLFLAGNDPVWGSRLMINSAVDISFYGYGEKGDDEPWILGGLFTSPRGFWAISETPAQPEYWDNRIQLIIPRSYEGLLPPKPK